MQVIKYEIKDRAGMGPACVGAGAGWVSLGGLVGSRAAGIGGCLQGVVSVACGC
jgi:hypothetical protein